MADEKRTRCATAKIGLKRARLCNFGGRAAAGLFCCLAQDALPSGAAIRDPPDAMRRLDGNDARHAELRGFGQNDVHRGAARDNLDQGDGGTCFRQGRQLRQESRPRAARCGFGQGGRPLATGPVQHGNHIPAVEAEDRGELPGVYGQIDVPTPDGIG